MPQRDHLSINFHVVWQTRDLTLRDIYLECRHIFITLSKSSFSCALDLEVIQWCISVKLKLLTLSMGVFYKAPHGAAMVRYFQSRNSTRLILLTALGKC
jgi:hypothetical protein